MNSGEEGLNRGRMGNVYAQHLPDEPKFPAKHKQSGALLAMSVAVRCGTRPVFLPIHPNMGGDACRSFYFPSWRLASGSSSTFSLWPPSCRADVVGHAKEHGPE